MEAEIESRALSAQEREALGTPWLGYRFSGLPLAFLLFVLFFLMMLLGMGTLAAIAGKLSGDDFHPGPVLTFALIALIWVPVLCVPGWIAWRTYAGRYRLDKARTLDAREGRVQVIQVRDPRLVTVDGPNGTLFLFDIGPARTLVVAGDILDDSELFGLASRDGDAADDASDDEWQGPDVGFPNTAFQLHRLPHTGRILRIATEGDPLTAQRLLSEAQAPLVEVRRALDRVRGDSLLIERPLDALVPAAPAPMA